MSTSSRRRSAGTRRSSSRRQSGRGSNSSMMMSEEQITDLVSKLQQLLPHIPPSTHPSHSHKQVSAAKVLQETCNYIRSLHREVDGLSDTLSQLLQSTDNDTAAIVRSLIM